jgi:hypothetical protein
MFARRSNAKSALFVAVLAASAPLAQAEKATRSAGITQVTKGQTLAERSSAAFDQIATVQSGRSRLEQIDPSLALKDGAEIDRLAATETPSAVDACTLTPEQQSIVTSLKAQGRLPEGECELVAWFARPGDKVQEKDRQDLAESVVTAAPELLGVETEAGRLAREAAEAELQRQQADAAAAAMALSILAPPPPAAPGN